MVNVMNTATNLLTSARREKKKTSFTDNSNIEFVNEYNNSRIFQDLSKNTFDKTYKFNLELKTVEYSWILRRFYAMKIVVRNVLSIVWLPKSFCKVFNFKVFYSLEVIFLRGGLELRKNVIFL